MHTVLSTREKRLFQTGVILHAERGRLGGADRYCILDARCKLAPRLRKSSASHWLNIRHAYLSSQWATLYIVGPKYIRCSTSCAPHFTQRACHVVKRDLANSMHPPSCRCVANASNALPRQALQWSNVNLIIMLVVAATSKSYRL